jgi:DNA-binding NarL/FixJ family response regulator
MTIRVLITDDQPVVRAGLRALLGIQPDIDVVGEARDGVAAVAQAATLNPDVVIMDVRMPGADGIRATEQIVRDPRSPKVLVLTTYDLDEYVFDALAAGASGFLLKDAPPEDLITGVRTVAAGDALLAPSVTRRLIALFARPHRTIRLASDASDQLTDREREVLVLIVRGLSNAEIAAVLNISDNTVKTHVGHVFAKLGLRDRVQAVIFGYESGLGERGDLPDLRAPNGL